MDKIKIFDTTLRDGEQSPGASMTIPEKVKIAKRLDLLGVDIIEAGFAVASKGDYEAISEIAGVTENAAVCSLSRAVEKDIETAAKAIDKAKKKRIHTFIATSPIHMEYKLKMAPDEVVKRAVKAVRAAKSFAEDVEFSCEDATRSEMPFLKEIISAAIEAGAGTINLPDTVGYATPLEYGNFVKELVDHVARKAVISVHCHNDLGLAVANSLSAVQNGAGQVECTINGLGERAGNAALEEIVMTLKTRSDYFGGIDTDINTKEIYGTSKLVATVCGIEPQPNKAVVGKNAFSHESGIHQDGVLKNASTYEIMKPSDVGIDTNRLSLGKLSGSHAFKDKLESLGFRLNEERFKEAFERFKKLADVKKEIYDDDIRAIASSGVEIEKVFSLQKLQISDCSEGVPTAAVTMLKGKEEITDAAIGSGTIDAIFKVIDRVTGYGGHLKDYKVEAVTEGKDALGRVFVKVEFDGKKAVMGHGLNVDTMVASARAYIDALNNHLQIAKREES